MKERIILLSSNFWEVILSQDQAYLGRSVVFLKRSCEELSSLTNEETLDFHENIVKRLESVFKKTFNATMFNWSCLMNNAYQKDDPKPYVHWHFRPRYNHKVKFAGKTFCDDEFAHHYNRKRKDVVSIDFLKKLSDEIKKNL